MDPFASGERLTRQHVSDAVTGSGWRLVLGELRAAVPVGSPAGAVAVAARAVEAAGPEGDHLRADLRPGLVLLALTDPAAGWPGPAELALAGRLAESLAEAGTPLGPAGSERTVQTVEIAIDALDVAAVRPFWAAVLGYAENSVHDVVDPSGQGPAVWFQQMDEPRPQRNRIHVDVAVPHDEAERRVAAALAAGGHLVSAARAPRFWILADAEGNEVCVTTWQGRDPGVAL